MVAKVKYTNRIPLEFVQGEIIDTDKEEHTSSSSTNSEKPEIWDLNRPLEGDCTLELLNFDDPVGKEVHNQFYQDLLAFLRTLVRRYFRALVRFIPLYWSSSGQWFLL